MIAQVIQLDVARVARRRAAILAELASFWGCSVDAVTLTTTPDGRGGWDVLAEGPGGRRAAEHGRPTAEDAEESVRPAVLVAMALVRLGHLRALETMERAFLGLAVEAPADLRPDFYAFAGDLAELRAELEGDGDPNTPSARADDHHPAPEGA